MSKVSVIIPVYNVEKYLKQCLDSVISQTLKDIEIIIVNDCSPDNSLKIIQDYQQKDKRIILIDLKKNVGRGSSRQEGIKVAKSKYIIFVDSDDWITNRYAEVLYNQIEKYNVDFVSAEYYFSYKNNIFAPNFNFNFYNNEISDSIKKFLFLFELYYYPVYTKIFKKDFLLTNKLLFRIEFLEDMLFIYEATIKSKKFVVIRDKLYYYRKDNNCSIMNSEETKLFNIYFKFFYELEKMLKNINKFEIYIREFYIGISLIFATKIEDSNLPFNKLKNIFKNFKKLYCNNINNIGYLKLISNKSVKFKHKIRLSLFFLCLKFNINYSICSIYAKKIFFFITGRNTLS